MKIATLQYQYDFPKDFETYRGKIEKTVEFHAAQGIDLLLFPEYAGLEMLSFATLEQLDTYLPAYLKMFEELSLKHRMLICNGTHVVKTADGMFNRSFLFAPGKKPVFQDKCVITPFEAEEGVVTAGNCMRLFETDLGKIGICICYDSEFPPLVGKLVDAGAELILVPSYTSTMHGYYRVFLSCRARALENQCYLVQSAIVGQTDIEMAYGASAICSPVDNGFPEDGLIAMGTLNRAESVKAEIDLSKLKMVRSSGQTKNFADSQLLSQRSISFELLNLR